MHSHFIATLPERSSVSTPHVAEMFHDADSVTLPYAFTELPLQGRQLTAQPPINARRDSHSRHSPGAAIATRHRGLAFLTPRALCPTRPEVAPPSSRLTAALDTHERSILVKKGHVNISAAVASVDNSRAITPRYR
jgi:hypothetical protein